MRHVAGAGARRGIPHPPRGPPRIPETDAVLPPASPVSSTPTHDATPTHLPHPPSARFATVRGVRLHYLDWGGPGEPLVMLPGMGQSAHVFDALAPMLAGRLRVLALSPRAHGPSEAPAGRCHVHDFAEEVVGFLDALEIPRAALAAHSLAGAVATRAAGDHPERVSRLVYLDGVADRAGWGRMQRALPAHPPMPPHLTRPEDDEAERAWQRTYVYGFWNDALEADWAARPPCAERERRREMHAEWVEDAVRHPPRYRELRAPALALVPRETVDTLFPWLDGDAELRARAATFLHDVRLPWRHGALARFQAEAPLARVAEVGWHHWLHLSSPERVAAEMLGFLARPGVAR